MGSDRDRQRRDLIVPWRPVAAALLIGCIACIGCQGTGKGPVGSIMSTLIEPFKQENPSEVARSAFNVSDSDKRRRAMSLLAAAPFGGAEPYVRLYRMMLGGGISGETKMVGSPDPDATVRAAAVKALGIHGTVDDVKIIIPRLEDEVAFVRWEAAKALGRIHSPSAIRPLLRTVRQKTGPTGGPDIGGDQDADVRQACAAALGQYATPAVFDGLVAALDDSDFGVTHAARRSLTTLTGYDIGTEPGDWLLWAKRHSGEMFKDQQVYRWQPFTRPPRVLDKVQFWKKLKQIPPRVPTGLTVQSGTRADGKG
ncbi:MAG: HEAT repeat domain-containing protein [Pirellulaceae bacterium]|jgi:hypothetical protein|nr:HEAT repeat domain-containing protein [Pirellulaceae bacterium]